MPRIQTITMMLPIRQRPHGIMKSLCLRSRPPWPQKLAKSPQAPSALPRRRPRLSKLNPCNHHKELSPLSRKRPSARRQSTRSLWLQKSRAHRLPMPRGPRRAARSSTRSSTSSSIELLSAPWVNSTSRPISRSLTRCRRPLMLRVSRLEAKDGSLAQWSNLLQLFARLSSAIWRKRWATKRRQNSLNFLKCLSWRTGSTETMNFWSRQSFLLPQCVTQCTNTRRKRRTHFSRKLPILSFSSGSPSPPQAAYLHPKSLPKIRTQGTQSAWSEKSRIWPQRPEIACKHQSQN